MYVYHRICLDFKYGPQNRGSFVRSQSIQKENKRTFRTQINRGTQRQFSENICSEDDLRSRIFGAFVVKFLACSASPRIFEHLQNGIITHF